MQRFIDWWILYESLRAPPRFEALGPPGLKFEYGHYDRLTGFLVLQPGVLHCLDGFEGEAGRPMQPHFLGCNHPFHLECIMEWLDVRQFCALCSNMDLVIDP